MTPAKITLAPFVPGRRELASGLHHQIITRLGIPRAEYPCGSVSGWVTCNAATWAITPLGLWHVSNEAAIAHLAAAYNIVAGSPARINLAPDQVRAIACGSAIEAETVHDPAVTVLALLARGAA